jgi:hypothetical protein
VREGAISCKACGADEQTGWAEHDPVETAQELDLERDLDDERYEEFLREDLGGGTIDRPEPSGSGFWLVVLGILAVAVLLAILVGSSRPR